MTVEGMEAKRIAFGDHGAEIRSYKLRSLRADEVLVKARCSLVSIGTETTVYLSRRWQEPASASGDDLWDFDDYGQGETWDMERNRGFPGYALAGDVIAAGEAVEDLQIGDRVVTLHNHADLAICPARPEIILKIPDNVSYEDSTFCVLGSVAMHAIHRSRLQLGEDVVIMGAGLVGLLTLQLAKLAGGRPVISIDLSPSRLELASKMGADYTVNPNQVDLVSSVREVLNRAGAVCTFEAVGNPAVLQSCMQISAPGGRIVVMGAIVGDVTLDMYSQFIFRELTLIASQQPRNPVKDSIYYHLTGQENRRALLQMMSTKSINTHDLVTHRIPYTDAPDIYRLLGEAKTADYDAQGNVHREMIGVVFNWQE